MVRRAVVPEDWSAFLDSFSARHDSWLVRPGGTLDTPWDAMALRGLRLEGEGGEASEVVVSVGDPKQPKELRLAGPTLIEVEETDDGIAGGLAITTQAGELILRFRTAIAPELVDGPPL